MARTAATEPISVMSALPTWAATNSPQEAPVRASPVRSRTCAHRLMVERVSHVSCLTISILYQTGRGELLTRIKRAQIAGPDRRAIDLAVRKPGRTALMARTKRVVSLALVDTYQRGLPVSGRYFDGAALTVFLAGRRAIDPSTVDAAPDFPECHRRGHIACRPPAGRIPAGTEHQDPALPHRALLVGLCAPQGGMVFRAAVAGQPHSVGQLYATAQC